MEKSIIVLAVPHQIQGENFPQYVNDPGYPEFIQRLIGEGVDFIFEEATGLGPSIAQGLIDSSLGEELTLDPTCRIINWLSDAWPRSRCHDSERIGRPLSEVL